MKKSCYRHQLPNGVVSTESTYLEDSARTALYAEGLLATHTGGHGVVTGAGRPIRELSETVE